MSSNINYTNINAAFPIAGQDNDSQGFRDNFSVIKTALSTASNEITDIQLNTARTDGANDFNGNVIQNATLKYNSEVVSIHANNQEATVQLNWAAGNYHVATVSTSTTFEVTNWPTDSLGRIRLEVTPTTSSAINISFSPIVGGVIRAQRRLPFTLTNSSYVHIWDIWMRDNGANTYIQYAGTWTTVTV